ncbi:ATPase, T2SS/T4P/T4SS family [Leuconostocaceae bacterium ESL0958]|nr:ATPase, T2SS/T4P/T4SS family [Leuconostocaceae bacterium ESL0958]
MKDWQRVTASSASDWLDAVLAQAVALRLTDLYFLPTQEGALLKTPRVGGIQCLDRLQGPFLAAVLAVIKYRAALNLAEQRRPQLGRFSYHDIFVRVSTVGDFLNREPLVLRLLYPELGQVHWAAPSQWQALLADQPNAGLYLLAGRTGAGKSTTAYQLLLAWADRQLVLTVEDPVELVVADFLQLQVNEAAGIDYQALIKVALRQRPDLLFIGEIRDQQTAQAALQAALAGHLVLATIHANSLAGTKARLINLAVDPVLLEQALVKVVYQRLVSNARGQPAAALSWARYEQGRVLATVDFQGEGV